MKQTLGGGSRCRAGEMRLCAMVTSMFDFSMHGQNTLDSSRARRLIMLREECTRERYPPNRKEKTENTHAANALARCIQQDATQQVDEYSPLPASSWALAGGGMTRLTREKTAGRKNWRPATSANESTDAHRPESP